MESTDAHAFGARLQAVAEVYGGTLSQAKAALYFEALADLPTAAVFAAMGDAVKTLKFMPKPSEIRALALGDSEEATEAAWMALRTALRRVGGYRSFVGPAALCDTLTALWGGWVEACDADLSPEMWASKRKEFGRVYRTVVQRGVVGSQRYLPGRQERANSGLRDGLTFVQVGVLSPGPEGPSIQLLPADQAEDLRALMGATMGGLQRLETTWVGDK